MTCCITIPSFRCIHERCNNIKIHLLEPFTRFNNIEIILILLQNKGKLIGKILKHLRHIIQNRFWLIKSETDKPSHGFILDEWHRNHHGEGIYYPRQFPSNCSHVSNLFSNLEPLLLKETTIHGDSFNIHFMMMRKVGRSKPI